MQPYKIAAWFAMALLSLGPRLATAQSATPPAAEAPAVEDLSRLKRPPRTIQDVLRAVESSKVDPTEIEKAKATLATPLPKTEDKEELHAYYRRRADANQRLGKIDEAIRDMRRATQEYRSSNQRARIESLSELGVLENRGGNLKNAIEAYEQSRQLITREVLGYFMTNNRHLVGAYSQAGDFAAAEAALRDAESTMVILRKSPNYFNGLGPVWESNLEAARATTFLFQGRWIESERAGWQALRKINEAVDYFQQKQKTSPEDPEVVRRTLRNFTTYKSSRQLDLAYAIMMQGRLVDAEIVCREAIDLTLKMFDRASVDVALGLTRLASIVAEQGRSAEAVALAQEALKTYQTGGASADSAVVIRGRRILGTAFVSDRKYQQADAEFAIMKQGADKHAQDGGRKIPVSDLDWVIAMLKVGKAPEALGMTEEMIESSTKQTGVSEGRMNMLQAFKGIGLHGSGKDDEARKVYASVMPKLIERIRSDAENLTASIKQQERMVMILEDNIALLAKQAQQHPPTANASAAQAFMLADLARGSTVQRALSASAARANIKDPKLAELARKEQDIQRRIASLEDLLTGLMSAPPEQQLPSVQAKMRTDIASFKQEREKLRQEIERKFPDYAELVNPKPASLDKARQLLKDDEVLVSWYFAEKEGFVWAITKQGAPQFHRIGIGRAQMAQTVATLRKSLDPGVATIDDIPAFNLKLAHELYQHLLAPVQTAWQDKRVMLAVPHGELGQLPLSVLVAENPSFTPKAKGSDFVEYRQASWLAKKIAVAQLPSVTALAALRNLPTPSANRRAFIGFGDPFFSNVQAKQADNQAAAQAAKATTTALATRGLPLKLRSAPKTSGVSSAELALLPRLPDTKDEIEQIGKTLSADPAQDIFLQRNASVSRVLEMDLSNRRVIMFATHGLVPGELDGLMQPALALSAPDVTGEVKGDGLLTMEQILTLNLNADWVVLSACNTASGEGAGSEAVSGLGRAFFFAGARALLVSNWPVDSEASRMLMTDLFQRQQTQQGAQKAVYLRDAMVQMMQNTAARDPQGRIKYSYAHPLFWAPFVVVGD
jgi:CHAT domain-containing protein